MMIQKTIEDKISAGLGPAFLEVINESHMHNVPPGSESHFKVIVVSDAFDGQSRVARHQTMNRLLADELSGGVHALSLQTHTADEWTARGGSIMETPSCLGGGRHDRD